jgi:phage terminase small subunit
MTGKPHPAPKHLQPATARWFRHVLQSFDLEQHHVRLLQLAAQAWDQAEEARAALATHGSTYTDRFGCPKARPEVAIARDATIAFARLIRELDLDVDPPSAPSRPAPLRSNRG